MSSQYRKIKYEEEGPYGSTVNWNDYTPKYKRGSIVFKECMLEEIK